MFKCVLSCMNKMLINLTKFGQNFLPFFMPTLY